MNAALLFRNPHRYRYPVLPNGRLRPFVESPNEHLFPQRLLRPWMNAALFLQLGAKGGVDVSLLEAHMPTGIADDGGVTAAAAAAALSGTTVQQQWAAAQLGYAPPVRGRLLLVA